jgi:hypothetical protein
MAIISELGNILKFMSGIHESRVIKLRKIRQLRLVARARKVGYVYRILIKS